MSDRFRNDAYDDDPPPDVARPRPTLPDWLARRLLHADEQVAWVRGPRFCPSWERHVTHISLFLSALALGAVLAAAAWLFAEMWPPVVLPAMLVAMSVVVASVIVLGLSCGYFTRLVATNQRLLIVQGYELCRSWNMDDLPPWMVRSRRGERGEEFRSVDFDAVKSMLGGTSDQFMDAKAILAFGKQLGQFKSRDDGRPS